MALVKYGGGIIQMSGSIAGNTFARNRSGNYVRARTKPVNPNTDRQQTVRANMGTVAHRWTNVLTQLQRDGWNEYAAEVEVTNRLGETIKLSGFNHYCRSNSAILLAGFTLVDAAPAIFTLPDTDPTITCIYDDAARDIEIAFDDTMEWLDENDAGILVYQGKPQSAGIAFFDGPWRFVDSIDGDSETAPTTPSTEPSQFVITAGQLAYTQFRILRADGRLSEFFRAPAVTVITV